MVLFYFFSFKGNLNSFLIILIFILDQSNAKSMYQSAMESHEDTPPQSNSDDRQDHDHDRQSMTSNDILDREDHYGDVDHLEESPSGPVWVWLTMGSCKLDPSHLPNSWFIGK